MENAFFCGHRGARAQKCGDDWGPPGPPWGWDSQISLFSAGNAEQFQANPRKTKQTQAGTKQDLTGNTAEPSKSQADRKQNQAGTKPEPSKKASPKQKRSKPK